ncbi:tRNA (adenosine(37)-N6)-threonylcarbamoyltransferase complex transferase subunit TsaD [Porphyrobacter sp. AAP60]|uniref:tRNA (adenosine(37)-N6)-threonylcarbamoyltransferase complex transferase subunit TsaD n=1 Tax=Porphyrobacter sp. AAP60 TaxID=1523423 RepID=UPI0006B9A970|nr:tRNA (adenosine(37)-N6)-threonylcarbamoyltransferase complex transferase subunit TsaD [Porphyrobacter sp. AAP60]KPF64352.1 protein kinase [Porphyrobacter sp. AAP60]
MGSATHTSDTYIVLGIESSCDETAVALVRGDRTIIAQAIASQEAEHAPYGGVVPEIAARAHAERVAPMVAAVMAEAGLTLDDVDAIAATAGPGLIGGVMVGLVSAKALAMAAEKPLLAINHLEGHALSPRLADASLGFPYLLLLVSGGHCQILAVEGVGQYRRLATTIDDALGEAFDKTAKLLGLGYPGGPAVERLALQGDPKAVPLPRPLKGSSEPHFSFAGLKSAVLRAKQNQGKSVRPELVEGLHFSSDAAPSSKKDSASTGSARTESGYSDADIAASFQQAAVDCLIDRLDHALTRAGSFPALVVAGGVAANQTVRAALEGFASRHAMRFTAPPLALCTDNAAMIAWAGCERLAIAGNSFTGDPLDFQARPRWPLDAQADTVRGAGVKA